MVSQTVFNFAIMIFFVIGGLSFGTFILFYVRAHRLVVRVPTSGNSMIEGYYWMVEKKDKIDKTMWWVSVPWQKKIKIQEPPSTVMDITKRGKKWVEVYRLSEDEYVFCRDQGLKANMILEETGEKFGNSFRPFSVVQRETIINQYKKANAEKQVDKLQMLINNIPVIVLGMVIILAIIYAGTLADAFSQVGETSNGLIQQAQKLYQSAGGTVSEIAPDMGGGYASDSESPP